VTNAGNKQSSTSAEAASARTVYDDIVWRIKQFQSNLEADEKMVVSIGGVASETMGLRGATGLSLVVSVAMTSERRSVPTRSITGRRKSKIAKVG
jgi:hypothetical protein